MNVLFHRKTFEPPLVKMTITDLVIMLLPAPGVGHGQARHEGRQLPVSGRTEQQMPVVGHDAVGKEADGHRLQGVGQHAFKRGEVLVLAPAQVRRPTI